LRLEETKNGVRVH